MPPPLPQPQAFFSQARVGLIFLALSALLANSCASRTPRRLTEGERRQIVNRYKEVIERAAGPQAWDKGIRTQSHSPALANASVEVLVLPAAFDAVLSAIESESKRAGFETRSNVTQSSPRRRSAELRVLRRREEVCRWRLREVEQLRRATIVIDDLGQDLEAARQFSELPPALMFSILPHLPHSVEIAEAAQSHGREVMLHLPMEPEPGSAVGAGEGSINVGMSTEEVLRTIRADLASVPHAMGVNNHMGSRATTHARLMTEVMKVLAEQRLYFVDSRTTAGSVALEVARRSEVPAFYRSVFLDDTKTTAYSLAQLREFRRVIERQGAALAIGHPYPTTLEALTQFLPELDRADIQLVPVSELVHLPQIARLSPPPRVAR